MKKLLFSVVCPVYLLAFPFIALAAVGDPVPNGTNAVPTPEPATLILIVSGLIGVLGFRKVFKK